MTLILKPKGRGNWNIVTLVLSKPPDLFAVKVGGLVKIGHWTFRICEVRA
jgi:hypothetical protein